MSTAVPLPAGSTLGKSFEYGIDVNTGTYAAPVWQPVRRISAFQPAPTPNTQDAQTYDDLGAANSDVTGWSFALAFNVQVNRSTTTGLYLVEIEAILARTKPTAKGEAAVLDVRWYHKPESGEPNPTDAGRGFTTVSYSRQNTGPNGEIEVLSVSLTGKGPYEEIANPFSGWGAAAPTITSITPTGQSVGDQVTITGSGFTGVTSVSIDAIVLDVGTYTVVGASTIVATIPATAAGAADVTITNATGISAAVNYAVAA